MKTQVLKQRYITKAKLHELCLALFGAGSFEIEVRLHVMAHCGEALH
jgi:hypothetical protein